MKKFLSYFLLGFVVLNCNDDDVDCTVVLPPPDNFTLKLIDQTGNSLIGNVYVQDSFKLYNSSETLYIKPFSTGLQDELVIFMADLTTNQDYYLELDPTDTDTLIVDYAINQSPCFSFRTLELFIYNEEAIYDIQNGGNDYNLIVTKN